MPSVTKQNPSGNRPPPKTNKNDIFSRVRAVTDHRKQSKVKISLYGDPKTGKTRLTSTFPKPLLIIGAEDGTQSIGTVKGVDFVLVRNSQEVAELLDGCVDRGYNTVAIDTASRLQDMVTAEILGLSEIPIQKGWAMADRQTWGQIGLQVKTILRVALDLPLHVVITAHERNFGGDEDGELMVPKIGTALTPSVAGWLNGAVDYVCQTFKREKVDKKKSTHNGKETTINVRTGKAEYCLRTGEHPMYITGFRLPPEVVLPDVIVNPTYDKIAALIHGDH